MTEAPLRPVANLKTLLTLAWPVIISRSTQTVVGLVDALMVAHLSEEALAATAAGAFNAFVILILPFGTVFIVSSFASQLFGKGDVVGARRYGWYGLWIAGATQVLGLVSLPLIDPILGTLDYSGEVRSLMTGYLQIRLLSAGFSIGMEALGAYYGGIGNTRRPMVLNVLAMVLNVFFCWVLVDGHFGAPKLGVDGAAWAAVLATGIAFVAFFWSFWREGNPQARAVLNAKEFWRMIRFGLPSGLNWFFEFFAYNVFINVAVAGLGTSAYAAMMSVQQINSFSFLPGFGLASAGAILVGQSIGAGFKDEVPKMVHRTIFVAAAWQGLVGVVYLIIPALLLSPFVGAKTTPDFMIIGVRMLMMSAAWQVFDAVTNASAESLRAAGDTAFTLWARLVLGWLVLVPTSLLATRVLGWGDVGAMASLVLYMVLLSTTLYLRFRTGRWRDIVLVEGAPAH